MDESYETLQDRRDVPGIVLEDNAIADTVFHVLQQDGGMLDVGNACHFVRKFRLAPEFVATYPTLPSSSS